MSDIKQILPAVGNWFRVVGTKEAPQFERVLFWAVVRYDGDDDVIVGVPREDIGVGGAADEWREGVAGYVELTHAETVHLTQFPDGLEQYNLIWEDE